MDPAQCIRLIRVKMGRKPHVQYEGRLTLLVIRIIWVIADRCQCCTDGIVSYRKPPSFSIKMYSTLLARAIDCGLRSGTFILMVRVATRKGRTKNSVEAAFIYSNNFDGGQCCFFLATIIS